MFYFLPNNNNYSQQGIMQFKDFFKRKPSLAVQILRGSFWGACLSYLGFIYIQNLPDHDFSDKEKDSLMQIFKDSVNIDEITFHRSQKGNMILDMLNAEGAQLGDTIITRTYDERDSAYHNYILQHEVAHIWQNQNCTFSLINNIIDEASSVHLSSLETYQYFLDPQKDLLDYHHEQQASIIADYFNKEVVEGYSLILNKDLKSGEADALYKAVLKKFLEDPNYIKQDCPLNFTI
jgi:hypothetical protein